MNASEALRAGALPIIKEVGAYLRTQFGKVSSSQIEFKERNSLVSYVDVSAEKMLVDGLARLLPEAGFITEEKTSPQALEDELAWVIDPLDGTTNFLHGIPFFSISVGLQEEKNYTLGIVYDVMHDAMYYAVQGAGAFKNEQAIKVSSTAVLADSLVATGFPYSSFDFEQAYLETFSSMTRGSRGMRRIGSAALDLALVAEGTFDAYFEYGLNAWDIAGGMCILQEAGGQVSSFHGGKVDPTASILASNGWIHGEMLGQMQPFVERGFR